MKKLFVVLMAIVTLLTVASCKKDEEVTDYGTAVAGVYTGKLMYGTQTVEDAYVVTITRISSTVVSMYANFLNGSANFNVSKNGSVYSLVSETEYNITSTVSGNQLTVSYLTVGDLMFTFSGKKD